MTAQEKELKSQKIIAVIEKYEAHIAHYRQLAAEAGREIKCQLVSEVAVKVAYRQLEALS